jgi:hypothetical protein
MSRQFSIALAIWIKSIMFNGFISSFILSVDKGPSAFLIGMLVIVLGFILTAPLLAIITPAVKAAIRLPYTTLASKAWLAFFLMLIAFLFLLAFCFVFDISIQKEFGSIIIGTLLSVLLATITLSKSIDNYKMETDASNMV